MSSGNWSTETRGAIVWSGTAFFAGKALTFLATLVLARLLTPSEFGVVAAITVYLTVIELVSDLGMQATVVYEQEEGVSERVQTAFTINLALVLVLTALAVLLAPVAAAFFDIEGETYLFRLGALNLLLIGLGNIPDALLLRGMRFRRRAFPLLVRAAIGGGVSIALAAGGLGPEALVFGLLAGSAAWTLVLWLMTPLRPTLSFDAGIARSMAGYGVASTTLDGIAVVGSVVPQAVIGRSVGAGGLGLYSIGLRLPQVLIQNLSSIVSYAAFPALSRQRMRDESGLSAATLALVRYQALYSLPGAVALAVLATPLIVVLFSSVWIEAGGVMAGIAVATAFAAISHPLGDALRAVGRQRTLVAVNLVALPLFLAVVVAAAEEGIVEVAWTLAAFQLIHLGVSITLTSRIVGVGLGGVVRAVAPALAACAGVAAGAGAVRLAWDENTVLPLLAGIAAGLTGGLAALRVFAPEQLRTVLRHLREITGRTPADAAP